MGIDNFILLALRGVLNNPILGVLREINISKILIQSNFIKRDIGMTPFQVLLHFVYMLLMNKRQSAFVKQSADAYGKDTYYRFVKDTRYNWRKLLMLSSIALIIYKKRWNIEQGYKDLREYFGLGREESSLRSAYSAHNTFNVHLQSANLYQPNQA